MNVTFQMEQTVDKEGELFFRVRDEFLVNQNLAIKRPERET